MIKKILSFDIPFNFFLYSQNIDAYSFNPNIYIILWQKQKSKQVLGLKFLLKVLFIEGSVDEIAAIISLYNKNQTNSNTRPLVVEKDQEKSSNNRPKQPTTLVEYILELRNTGFFDTPKQTVLVVECQSFCPKSVTVFMSAFKSTEQVLAGESDHGNQNQIGRIL